MSITAAVQGNFFLFLALFYSSSSLLMSSRIVPVVEQPGGSRGRLHLPQPEEHPLPPRGYCRYVLASFYHHIIVYVPHRPYVLPSLLNCVIHR